eukprot:PRCOL_00000362-RA
MSMFGFKPQHIKKWNEVAAYPLIVVIGAAASVCAFQCSRHLTSSPDVRINKADRAAGYLENFKEGARFKDHALKRLFKGRSRQVMGPINSAMSN